MKSKAMLILRVSFIIVFCVVVLIVLFGPSYLSVSMSCVEIMEDEVMGSEREIDIRGLRLSPLFGNEKIILFQLQVSGTEYALFQHDPRTVHEDNATVFWTNVVFLGDYNKVLASVAAWTSDGSSCIVRVDDRIFVGSASENYADALAQFDAVVSIGD